MIISLAVAGVAIATARQLVVLMERAQAEVHAGYIARRTGR